MSVSCRNSPSIASIGALLELEVCDSFSNADVIDCDRSFRTAPVAAGGPAEPPGEPTREALWRHAGLRRDAEGLRELLGDRYPLARLIAAACFAREESRGAHQRTDHPDTDPSLDLMHTLVGQEAEPSFERWQ